MLAHGAVLCKNGFTTQQVIAILEDYHTAGLNPEEVHMMDYATKISTDSGTVGAADLAVAVTRRNAAAQALYAGLGMTEAARYHYRRAPEAPDPGRFLPEARGSTNVAAGNARGV